MLESPVTRQTDDHKDLVVKSGARLLHHPAHHSLSAQKEKLKDLHAPNDDPFIQSQSKKVPQKKIKTRLNLDLKNLNKINIYDGGEKVMPIEPIPGAEIVDPDEA